MVIDQFLSKLKGVRRSGRGWSARCPAHDDECNSLSVSTGDDGRILVNCFVACSADEVVRALGLTLADLFPHRKQRHRSIHKPFTIEELARAKKLPFEYLRFLGLEDSRKGVVIPYQLLDGSPAARSRLRSGLVAVNNSSWLPGEGKVVPYGLDRLHEAKRTGSLVIVEGESDCWTLWFHGFPCLGIPGAKMANCVQRDHILAMPGRLFVYREADDGGKAFVAGIAGRVNKLGWSGDLRIASHPVAKDPNELHRRDPEAFPNAFREVLEQARPWSAEPIATRGSDAEGVPDGLLEEVVRVFGERGDDRLPTPEIIDGLSTGSWAHVKTGRALASLLRPHDVRPSQFRHGGRVGRGYFLKDLLLKEGGKRYTPSQPVRANQLNDLHEVGEPVHPLEPSGTPARSGTPVEHFAAARDAAPDVRSCHACKGTRFWQHTDAPGAPPVCARCHPPAQPLLVSWLEPK